MDKGEIRSLYKSKRELIDIDKLSQAIFSNLLDRFSFEGKIVSVFIPIEKFREINTWPFLEASLNNDHKVCVPKADLENKTMIHFEYQGKGNLKKNEWDILEPIDGNTVTPESIDVILIPLLAYDSLGNRVGYGGGFYDRFLAQCRKDTLKIGLSFFTPLDEQIESNSTDIRMNYCVSPHKVYEFE